MVERLTGPADKGGFCARARIEIMRGGSPGTMDVLVHPPAFGRHDPVPIEGVVAILAAALRIARTQQRGGG
jgi:hypothetical protein